MIDIVIPNNNEEEFIVMAEKLGYTGLCFLYDSNDYMNKQFENKKIKIEIGVLGDNKNIDKIKGKNEKVFVAVKSSNNDKEIMERSKADMIFSFEDALRRDFIHQRASGLNHILCRLAKENNVIVGFSLKSILISGDKHLILGRIRQNIKICRKFKVKTTIASFAREPFEMRNAHDVMSLFKILGYDSF